jgi:hypothetical protein
MSFNKSSQNELSYNDLSQKRVELDWYPPLPATHLHRRANNLP